MRPAHTLQAGDWTSALHALVAGTSEDTCSAGPTPQQQSDSLAQQQQPDSPGNDLQIQLKDTPHMPSVADVDRRDDDSAAVRVVSRLASVAGSMRSALFAVSAVTTEG